VKRLRFIATVRNKIVHEANYQAIDDRAGYVKACDEAEAELRAMLPVPAGRGCFGLAVAGMLGIAGLVWRLA
jgi:hypothetical protein